MDPVYDFGLEASRWLQTQYPQLRTLMVGVSALGRFEFYLVILPLIYWCLHKQFGKQLIYIMAVANLLVNATKHLLRQPRPYWLDDSLALSTEPSYGIPSGHTISATVTYLFFASWVRRRWAWVLAGLVIFLMGLSRVYLGVHFVHDVVAGFILGVLVLIGDVTWRRNFHQQFRNRILGQRLLVVILVAIVPVTVYALVLLLLGAADETVAWGSFVAGAERESLDSVAAAAGLLLGVGMGFVLEATRVHFVVDGSARRRALRYLVGMVVVVLIWRGLGSIFPEDPLWLALPLRLFRYWLAGMWVAYYGPYIFIRLDLADASPEPDVRLTVADGGLLGR